MQFDYLLQRSRQFYHKNQTPPKFVFGIDPGETIGYCVFKEGNFLLADQTDNLNYLLDLLVVWKPDVVVYEDYKIYPNKLKVHTFSEVPTIETIGVIKHHCEQQGFKVMKMLASTAKGFCTPDKLKEWGFHIKGKPHACDSIRLVCYYLLFGKE